MIGFLRKHSARIARAALRGPTGIVPLALLAVSSVSAQTIAPEKLQLCASCHGVNGTTAATPDTPYLAGLQTTYFARQMADFKSGKRKSAIMQGIAATLSEKDVQEYAAYFREQKPPAPGKGDPKLIAQGKEIYFEGIVGSAVPACSSCHNEDGTGTNRYPRLAGQNPVYTISQMLAYKSGARNNDDRELMRAVAQRMTEAEIRAVSEFIVTMKGDGE
jgi:cytochrome c553